jgi:hypothetical protein
VPPADTQSAMTRAYPGTPIWVKLTICAVVVTALVWWVADRQDRLGNASGD